jgi:hypothetical protein
MGSDSIAIFFQMVAMKSWTGTGTRTSGCVKERTLSALGICVQKVVFPPGGESGT